MKSKYSFIVLMSALMLGSCADQGPDRAQIIEIINKFLSENRSSEKYRINLLSNINYSKNDEGRTITSSFDVNITDVDSNMTIDVRDFIITSKENPLLIKFPDSESPFKFESNLKFKVFASQDARFSEVIVRDVSYLCFSKNNCVFSVDYTEKNNANQHHTAIDGNMLLKNGKFNITIKNKELIGTNWRKDDLRISFMSEERLEAGRPKSTDSSYFEWKKISDSTLEVKAKGTGGFFGQPARSGGPRTRCLYSLVSPIKFIIHNCEYHALEGTYFAE